MATATADPTRNLIDRLADASQWHIIRGVPVFDVHVRSDGGTEPVRVGADELERIVARARFRREHKRVVPVIQIGHTRPKEPEPNQPDIVGFADHWREGTFDGKPCLLVDEFYEKAEVPQLFHPDGRAKYPFRSVEYDPRRHEVTRLAVLKRDPERDLGLVYGRCGGVVFYSRSQDMPLADPTMQPQANPMPAPAPADEHPVLKYHRKLERFMKKCYERDPHAFDDFDGEDKDGEDKDKPAELPPPDEGRDKDKPGEPYQRGTLSFEMAQLRRQVTDLARDRDESRQLYARSEGMRRVQELQTEGYVFKDPAKKAGEFAALATDAARDALADDIRVHYQRDDKAPTGGSFLNLTTPPGNPGGRSTDPDAITVRERDAAIAYMRKHETEDFDAALAEVRKQSK